MILHICKLSIIYYLLFLQEMSLLSLPKDKVNNVGMDMVIPPTDVIPSNIMYNVLKVD